MKIVCIDPIEGYLTLGKEYDFQGLESYAGRAVVPVDDSGKEGHFNPDRFLAYGIRLPEALKMKRVILTKIVSTHQNLRTDSMEGLVSDIPDIGQEMTVYGTGLITSIATRQITTTEVKEVTYDAPKRTFTFKTQNSTYTLEMLK